MYCESTDDMHRALLLSGYSTTACNLLALFSGTEVSLTGVVLMPSARVYRGRMKQSFSNIGADDTRDKADTQIRAVC